jgi:hypothetical protein
VDDSLFGGEPSSAPRTAGGGWAPPWNQTKTRPTTAPVPSSDRTSWLAPGDLKSARAPNPQKYRRMDIYRGDATANPLPARGAKKTHVPSDPWRDDGPPPPGKKVVDTPNRKATVKLI